MAIFSTAAALPRQELAYAVVEGANSVSGLIGSQILGPFGISWRNAHLVKATLAGSMGLRDISADKYKHAAGTKFERLTATLGDATITVSPRGVELVIPREVMLDYSNRFDVMAFFLNRFGREMAGLTTETLIAAQIFSTGNFGSATNSTVAYTAANLATISFIGDMIAAARRLKAKGEGPGYVAAMSGPVFERIRQATTVQSYAAGTLKAGQEATKGTILEALREFGFVDLLIGDAYINTAADGATASLSQVWSNTYIFVGRPGMTGTTDSGAGVASINGVGVNAYWEGYANGIGTMERSVAGMDAQIFDGGNYIETYYEPSIDSEVIRLKKSDTPTILNSRAGDLVATQYA